MTPNRAFSESVISALRPIHLGRVCLGIFVVVNGVVWSKGIINCS